MADDPLNLPGEVWKDVPGHEDYEVSSLGRVRRKARLLKTWHNRSTGYDYVGLGKRWKGTVHRLVCLAFHGSPQPSQTDVAHGDGDRRNNRLDNLRWATRSENTADAVRHGTSKLNQYRTDGYKPKPPRFVRRGVDASAAKLNFEKAQAIRDRHAAGEKATTLMARFGVGKSTIYRVLKRAVWT